jgi:uncharacterized membrane protein
VSARVEAATASLEGRVDRVIDRLGDLAQGAVLLAILGIAALVTALMAAAAGLIAVYRLTADAYGDYAGLGVVAAILIAVTLILLALMIARVRGLEAPKVTAISPASDARASHERSAAAVPAIPVPVASASTFAAPVSTFDEDVPAVEAAALPLHAPASAGDLIEPLTYILSDVVRIPTFVNSSVDQIIDKLRGAAHSNAEETVHRAANVVRFGSRLDLVFVLGGTAAVAWLVTRNAQPRP